MFSTSDINVNAREDASVERVLALSMLAVDLRDVLEFRKSVCENGKLEPVIESADVHFVISDVLGVDAIGGCSV